MQYSLSLLLALTSVFLEVKGFADDNIFYTDDLDDPNLLSDSSPDLFALNDPTGEFNQYEDVPFDSLLPLPEGAEMEPDSVVAGCLAPDRLGARDDATLCPTNDFKSPELPTLDGFTDKFHPPNEQDNVLKEISPLRYLAPPGEDKKCPADRPYQLCCICDGNFEFAFCQDCRQMSDVGACFSPHMEVCCEVYGVVTYNTPQLSYTNLDVLLAQYNRQDLRLDMRPQDGTIAQTCQVPPK